MTLLLNGSPALTLQPGYRTATSLRLALALAALGFVAIANPAWAQFDEEGAAEIEAQSEGAEVESSATPAESTSCGEQILRHKGVYGITDGDGRSPLLTVGIDCIGGDYKSGAVLRASVSNDDSDYTPEVYPYTVEFYVNGKLIEKQITSKGLPRALALSVTPEIAAVPFNYTVLTTVQVPNRQYTTHIEGAVLGYNLKATLDCTLKHPATESSPDGITMTVEDAKVTQTSSSAFLVRFEEEGKEVAVTATVNEGEATGSIVLAEGEKRTTTSVEGTATATPETGLTSFSLSSEDELTTISCQ